MVEKSSETSGRAVWLSALLAVLGGWLAVLGGVQGALTEASTELLWASRVMMVVVLIALSVISGYLIGKARETREVVA